MSRSAPRSGRSLHVTRPRAPSSSAATSTRSPCAPPGFWTRTDSSAHQDPGSQQVYGTDAFRSPSARVLPAMHSDHDFLLVRAYRKTGR
jgi:hypothetical protein